MTEFPEVPPVAFEGVPLLSNEDDEEVVNDEDRQASFDEANHREQYEKYERLMMKFVLLLALVLIACILNGWESYFAFGPLPYKLDRAGRPLAIRSRAAPSTATTTLRKMSMMRAPKQDQQARAIKENETLLRAIEEHELKRNVNMRDRKSQGHRFSLKQEIANQAYDQARDHSCIGDNVSTGHDFLDMDEPIPRTYSNKPSTTVLKNMQQLSDFKSNNAFLFVLYCHPGCSWCQQAAPAWEALALEGVDRVEFVAFDCEALEEVCREEKIFAFPTIRLHANGEVVKPDYTHARSVPEMKAYLKSQIDDSIGVKGTQELQASNVEKFRRTIAPPPKPSSLFPAWDIPVEYAARVTDRLEARSSNENVIIAYTSSDSTSCRTCRKIRLYWHLYAKKVHEAGMKNLLVAEVDCSEPHHLCPAGELPFYQWYHRGSEVGGSVPMAPERMDGLMGVTEMMLGMENARNGMEKEHAAI